ncbi:serine hydrolase [Wenzhouxiangella sp. AB-CW3]|uniref:serine hydrolase domain-containing protein n=1 Tax=Wenzhouxiangella sp. AB-CW3 TaxID=2771012 RepID=UPI00168AEB38|nr:serine hydrolase [Wenzhouxiangella sp. AB-CW3]QOC22733.1 serine hydrolase [Wenzhouxiangella sp. AB-CW3]
MPRWLPLALLLATSAVQSDDYFPERDYWEQRPASELGFDPDGLDEAVAWARSQADTDPSDLYKMIYNHFAPREPDFRILGPTRPRAGDSGMIIRNGYIAASWGDLDRADMVFSVAKSFLSTVAALALDDGAIIDLDEPVGRTVQEDHFAGPHNSAITWHHLLQQTSEWEGTLWDVPDWADRPEGDDPADWPNRELQAPGSRYKYNDVRVNLLAYSLLQVMREPLPVVLRERIMDPIGASPSWRWHGYHNSWVELDGQHMQSVSGGGHFGGGMFISTEDMARFGLLFKRRGGWDDQRVFSADWIDTLAQPVADRPDYGYLWWLNTDRERIPQAPESAYWAAGFGGNFIYVDEENDLVIVLRWIPELEETVARVLDAINQPEG